MEHTEQQLEQLMQMAVNSSEIRSYLDVEKLIAKMLIGFPVVIKDDYGKSPIADALGDLQQLKDLAAAQPKEPPKEPPMTFGL